VHARTQVSRTYSGVRTACVAKLFPFFIWLATCRIVTLQQIILIASVSVYVLCLTLFITLHPIF